MGQPPSMLEIDVSTLEPAEIYKLVGSALVPRPIAWITTLNETGKVNLAPFSFFTAVSIDPPLFLVNCDRRAGMSKDTTVNAKRSGELVINVVSENLILLMHQSSVAAPPETSEAELLKITLSPSRTVKTPRVADAPVSIECRLERVLEVGRKPNDLLFAEAKCFHIRSDLYRDGSIDVRRLRPLARLGGTTYAMIGELRDLPDMTALDSLQSFVPPSHTI